MKPLIGIVGKPYKGERWNYIKQVDEIREVLVKNGANVIGIISNSIHSGKLIETGKYDIAAVSEDGLTEAIEYKNKKFNLGIQWHPELMYKFDKDQEKIFQYFINNL